MGAIFTSPGRTVTAGVVLLIAIVVVVGLVTGQLGDRPHQFKLTGDWGGVLDCEVLEIEPQASPALSKAARTFTGSMCEGSSIGSSTESKPHFLNFANSFTLSVVNGETNRKELMPNLMV